MAKRARPGGTPALAALSAAGVDHTVRTYDHDEATSSAIGYGHEAAQALGVEPGRVFKTLMVDAGGQHVLGVVPVTHQLDLKALAHARDVKKARLVSPDVAERVSGSVVGAVSPVAGRAQLPVVLDESALTHATILVSAGRRGTDVELAPADLVALTGATTAHLAR